MGNEIYTQGVVDLALPNTLSSSNAAPVANSAAGDGRFGGALRLGLLVPGLLLGWSRRRARGRTSGRRGSTRRPDRRLE